MTELLREETAIEDDSPLLHPGRMIHKYRKLNRLSQTEFAAMMGIGRRTLYNWEHELARIDFVDVVIALSLLNCEVTISEWTYPRR